MTKIAYIGNFGPANSTENHYAEAFENIGVDVVRIQEAPHIWAWMPQAICPDGIDYDLTDGFDFVMWTHTHGLSPETSHDEAWHALKRLRQAGVPTVAVHLDRWWGLEREHQTREPFFACDYVFTADGGHDGKWGMLGINHVWLPPAVISSQAILGTPRPEFRSKLAFVGSWQGGYHAGWDHRPKLIAHLQRKWAKHCEFWPKRGEHAVRGQDLIDLYASVDVLIGDSCLVGGSHHYYSDRIPETLGRGGALVHPYTEGLDGEIHYVGGVRWMEYESGIDLATFPAYDFKALDERIEYLIETPAEREFMRTAGRNRTLADHTYEKRAQMIIGEVLGR